MLLRLTCGVFLASQAVLSGCGSADHSHSTSSAPENQGPNYDSAGADQNNVRRLLTGLFRDDVAFTAPELTGGKTNCDDVLSRKNIAGDIVPWPDELRSFLVEELMKLPIKTQVLNSVFAYYLVKEAVLTESSDPVPAAGLACDRGNDYEGVIFLNATTFITDRQAKGIGTWQDLKTVQENHILLESGDNAAMTLFHETMHAIDNKLMTNGVDPEARSARAAIAALSWNSDTDPKYPPISIMTLTGGPTGQALATDLKFLATKTNFIVPYAARSPAEDWAESLTVYYFGTYRDVWQNRYVYKNDVSENAIDESGLLYSHETQAILRASDIQRDKMCQMANLLFGSCKL